MTLRTPLRIATWRNAFLFASMLCVIVTVFEFRVPQRVRDRYFAPKFPWHSADSNLLDLMTRRSLSALDEPRRSDLLVPILKRKSNIEEHVSQRLNADPPNAMPYGCLAFGLIHANRVNPSEATVIRLAKLADEICDRDGNLTLSEPLRAEQGLAGWLLVELSALLREPRYMKAAAQLATLYTSEYPKSSEGTIGYNRRNTEQLLVDTIGLLCPFLAKYGALAGDSAATDLAVHQIKQFIARGSDPLTGIPWHAYGGAMEGPYGAPDWSRGAGWMMIGLAETVKALPEGDVRRAELTAHWRKLTDALVRRQRPDGLWSWALNIPDASPDTSATAMFVVAIQEGINMGILPTHYGESVARSAQGLAKKTDSKGQLTHALYDCQGIGHYPKAFGPSPFGQGFGTAAIALFSRSKGQMQQPRP